MQVPFKAGLIAFINFSGIQNSNTRHDKTRQDKTRQICY